MNQALKNVIDQQNWTQGESAWSRKYSYDDLSIIARIASTSSVAGAPPLSWVAPRMPIAGLVKSSSRSSSEPAIQASTHCLRPYSGLPGQTIRGMNVEN